MQLQTLVIRSGAAALIAASLAACTIPGPTPPRTGGATPSRPQQQSLFIRPASGTTVARFDGVRNKGIDIAGNIGDPILASSDGRVAVVSSDLPAYGNMVIISHNDIFLTAYAHLQTISVKEGTVVRQGQKIGEMGRASNDPNRPKLHFEIRKNSVAVDPEPYLSGRLQQ